MYTKLNQNRFAFRLLNRAVLGICILLGLIAGSSGTLADDSVVTAAPSTPPAMRFIPAARQADRIAVITIEGAIDGVTAMSVKRRIEAAEVAGMDAIVLEIDSPGGGLGAVLEISNMIKMSSISNSVAWIRPEAFSGGAIIALACDEIVSSDPASMGDAFIILVHMFGLEGMQALSPEERTKLLPPLMADVTDSARRSGYDEYLVQAIVADGIELWFVEEIETGHRLAINEEEYGLLFPGNVVRGKPMLAEVTGGVQTYSDPSDEDAQEAQEGEEDENKDKDEADARRGEDRSNDPQSEEAVNDPNAYRPASPTLDDIEEVFANPEEGFGLDSPSLRPVFSAGDFGKYRMLGYITDGSAAIVMRDDQLDYFGFSSGIIQNDAELSAFFGAKELVRVRMNWSEKLVRFLVNPFVRGLIIVVLLISVFIEMVMAGTGLAGAVAVAMLALLLGPGAMIGLSGWWELIAIIVGIVCLAIEAFVIPGFGVFGIIGLIALFGGLIGTFVGSSGTMSNPQMQKDMMTGTVTVLLSFITAGIGWWLIIKNAHELPVFNKFILSGASGVGGMPAKSMLHAIVVDDGSVRVGSEGITTTPLHPIGQGAFGDEIVDVYAAFGTIEQGVAIRVVSATSMRIEVQAIENNSDENKEGNG